MKHLLAFAYRLGYPFMQLYWYVFRPTTEGVRCIVRDQGQVLLIMHTYGPKRYSVPGGGLKKNETLEEAACRELYEEVGLRAITVTHTKTTLKTDEYKKDVVHICEMKVADTTLSIDATEIKEAAWFPINDLPEDLYPSLKRYLEASETTV